MCCREVNRGIVQNKCLETQMNSQKQMTIMWPGGFDVCNNAFHYCIYNPHAFIFLRFFCSVLFYLSLSLCRSHRHIVYTHSHTLTDHTSLPRNFKSITFLMVFFFNKKKILVSGHKYNFSPPILLVGSVFSSAFLQFYFWVVLENGEKEREEGGGGEEEEGENAML